MKKNPSNNNIKIKSVLIANRGEIALRIIKTLKRLNIKSVCIYAEDDGELPFVKVCDERISLGMGTLKETYLNQELIIKIAKERKVDAIHPGYGLLSENANFAKKVNENGIIFIGPTAEHIKIMGSKHESKILAEKVKVPLIPGYHGDNQDEEHLIKESKKMGFPILIKASYGGGGKGMRVVQKNDNFSLALREAKAEAASSFGNDHVILEKYIEQPRHIEVQVISDLHGGHFHLFERECSIQRRNQKIIEESPSSFVDDQTRKKITDCALMICREMNYLNAGTLEFLMDKNKNFYFLEMNTRLQVEHPVTEMITGVDIVEKQIRVMEGKKAFESQDEIQINGHAIEARIYAEDPDKNFSPSTGVIKLPRELEFLELLNARHERSMINSNRVGISYDPMIAKLVYWSKDRKSSILGLLSILDEYIYLGIKTNRDYLKRILKHSKFIAGDFSTAFIFEECTKLEKEKPKDEELIAIIAGQIFSKKLGLNSNDKVQDRINNQISINSKKGNPALSSWDILTDFKN